jgi:hypothetical protein
LPELDGTFPCLALHGWSLNRFRGRRERAILQVLKEYKGMVAGTNGAPQSSN